MLSGPSAASHGETRHERGVYEYYARRYPMVGKQGKNGTVVLPIFDADGRDSISSNEKRMMMQIQISTIHAQSIYTQYPSHPIPPSIHQSHTQHIPHRNIHNPHPHSLTPYRHPLNQGTTHTSNPPPYHDSGTHRHPIPPTQFFPPRDTSTALHYLSLDLTIPTHHHHDSQHA